MSGIVGLYRSNDQVVDSAVLRRMTGLLAHRGPDRSAIWHDGPVGFGHCMLWTTPESLLERLPMANDDGTLIITADARIDNRNELISTLNLSTPPEQLVDSELILHAYQRWGDRCPEHLLGDFAFAVWDGEKQRLFCARDHMGLKPFYYYLGELFFAFASESKSLLSLPEVPRDLNETWLAGHLVMFYEDLEATSYKHISRLAPAHSLTIDAQGAHFHRYWSLDATRETHFDTNEEYKRAFREVFTEAVSCRLRSAFPVGASLSGGLDSSAIVCIARDLLRQHEGHALPPLRTFSFLFDKVAESDERSYIDAVLELSDLDPSYVHPDELSPFYDIEHMLWHMDEASYLFPGSHATWALNKAASDMDVRVLLSGELGDVVVSYGDMALFDYVRALNLRAALAELRYSRHYYNSRRAMLSYEIASPLTPRFIRRMWQVTTRPVKKRITAFYTRPELAQRCELEKRLQKRLNARARARTSREFHYYELTSGALVHLIEQVEKNAAAHSLELRLPFLDRRLVEFCLALPPEQKRRNGYTRVIERSALAAYLPPEISRRRSKASGTPYLSRGLLDQREYIRDTLNAFAHPIEPYIDYNAICQVLTKSELDGVDIRATWNATILARWLDTLRATTEA